jgi:hypothetical protein
MADRFVSPGVFTREKDLSFLPQEIAAIGGAVIGPTLYGPAFRPTTVSNYAEFIRAFGNSFISGSGAVAKEYKFLTNYTAQEYLRYGENLTVLRIVNSDATIGYSNIVKSGSYQTHLNEYLSGGDEWALISASLASPTSTVEGINSSASLAFRNTLTGSVFSGSSDPSFRVHLMFEGEYGNSGAGLAATNGIASPADEDSLGLLNTSGSRHNFRWEINNVNHRRGTFNLILRRGDDRTGRKVIIEQYNNLSLDPNDPGYVPRVIGDQFYTLRGSGTGRPYLQLSGSYPNRSRFIRVEMLGNDTLNYIDEAGRVRDGALSGSLPAAVSGTFAFGSDGYVHHPRAFYGDIVKENTQGFNLHESAAGISGSTAYYDAIDILSHADEYDINMLFMPGIVDNAAGQHSDIVTYAIATCEERGDVFIVVDPTRYGDSVGSARSTAEGRTSNYAAMYYPWIQVSDPDLNRNVWIPPSCVVAGVLTFNDYVKFPWFAPAGLNRGGIEIAVQAEKKLTTADRDDLYASNINPIATYPRDGVVVWGQKTLQKKRSALDRINVRRLLIAAKKFVASSSRYLVFEQNTVATRDRFIDIVTPYFNDVRQKEGLYDFRVVMDESNNTPEVIDRNELRGAIYLKPTRTAEFVIIDFFVLPTGAVFPTDTNE